MLLVYVRLRRLAQSLSRYRYFVRRGQAEEDIQRGYQIVYRYTMNRREHLQILDHRNC